MNSSELTDLYQLCPKCGGSGQIESPKAKALGFLSLPCPDCELVRVVKIQRAKEKS